MSEHDQAPARRALLFRLPGDESARNALNLARCAEQAGLNVTMVPYWPDNEPVWHTEQPLLAQDIGSAPRLSAFALEQDYGLSLDLLDLQAHSLATGPVLPDLILPESVWQQRLRGVAATLVELFEREKPDLIFIAHGAEVVSRLITEVAAFKDIKALFWESGFFPDHLYVDSAAPHFFRGLTSLEIAPASASGTGDQGARFIADWKQQRQSKYAQNTSALHRFKAWKAEDTRPVLFVAGQVPTDANAVVGLGHHKNLHSLYSAILDLPASWRMVFKPHPKAPADLAFISETDSPDIFCGDIPVLDAIENSDAVLVHSSNVGLEALLLNKPVLVTGQPVYAASGQTIHVKDAKQLAALLSGPLKAPDSLALSQFVERLLDHSLIHIGDHSTLKHPLEQARIPERNRALLGYYAKPVQALGQAARHLHNALQTTPLLDAALSQLKDKDRHTLARHLDEAAFGAHLYGGGELAKLHLATHPVRGAQKPAHTALPVRLEDCAFPLQYLRNSMTDAGHTYSVGCQLLDTEDTPSAQRFSASDLEKLAKRLGRNIEIVDSEAPVHTTDDSTPASSPVTVYFKPVHRPNVSYQGDQYANWFIPLDAFQHPGDVVRLKSGAILLCGDHVHAAFGPYLPIPEGVWQVRWSRRGLGVLDQIKARLFRRYWKKLSFEVIETLAERSTPILCVPYWDLSARIETRADARYELRPHWQGKAARPSAKLPVFNGIELRWIGPKDR